MADRKGCQTEIDENLHQGLWAAKGTAESNSNASINLVWNTDGSTHQRIWYMRFSGNLRLCATSNGKDNHGHKAFD